MKTKIIKINSDNIDSSAIAVAADILKRGGLVAIPTETVYGLAADALNTAALSKIYLAKGRPSDNPLIVHISDLDQLNIFAKDIPDVAYKLAKRFWPGPLTMIFKKQPSVNNIVTGGLNTVAIRMPAHPIARELIRFSQIPLAAPSANISGSPSPTTARHVINDMDGKIDAVIASQDCEVGIESTVLDLSGTVPSILRPGAVTYEQLLEFLPNLTIDKHVLNVAVSSDAPKSPGMKYKHYAPKASVTVVQGGKDNVFAAVDNLCIRLHSEKPCKIGVITCYEHEKQYKNADIIISSGRSLDEFAHNMFTLLRTLDEKGMDNIIIELSSAEGIGLALANRLYRAAGNNVIHVQEDN